jgi:DNA-directed RNA polymerase subunit RPC12/RpoP
MRCEHCSRMIVTKKSRTMMNDYGSLAVTAWRCARCGGITEEVRVLEPAAGGEAYRSRYAVARHV